MNFLELFVLSAALGADLFSVSVPIGMLGVRMKLVLRAAFVFAVFHIAFILSGYYGGHWLGQFVDHVSTYHLDYSFALVQNWAAVFGAIILIVLGIHMVRESLTGDQMQPNASLQGSTLLALAFSVSVDAFVAGFSLGMIEVDLWKLSAMLGIVIFAIAIIGLSLGRRVGKCFGVRASIVGSFVLIGLGLHIIWTAIH